MGVVDADVGYDFCLVSVNAVFAVEWWPHGQAAAKDFPGHLNSRHPIIAFSVKLERDHHLSFLDVLVNWHLDNSMGYVTYRKATYIDLQAALCHPPAYKRSIITILVDKESYLWQGRAGFGTTTCSVNFLSHWLHPNPDLPRKVSRKGQTTEHTFHVSKEPLIDLQATEEAWHEHNTETLNWMAPKFKSMEDGKLLAYELSVYKIPYSCGKVHIGQIGCHFTGISEHIRDTRLENQQSSVAEHSTTIKHSIIFNKTSGATILA